MITKICAHLLLYAGPATCTPYARVLAAVDGGAQAHGVILWPRRQRQVQPPLLGSQLTLSSYGGTAGAAYWYLTGFSNISILSFFNGYIRSSNTVVCTHSSIKLMYLLLHKCR